MKKKLKSLKQILDEHKYNDDDLNMIVIYYGNNTCGISRSMRKYFGTEIEVSSYIGINYEWHGKGWAWKDDWFENEFLLEDELFEI